MESSAITSTGHLSHAHSQHHPDHCHHGHNAGGELEKPILSSSAASTTALRETTHDIIASVVGSAACVYTGQPFDTVKVRLQVNPGQFTSVLGCLSKTIRQEGLTALWRGSSPAFIGALSENAVAFAVNGMIKRLLYRDAVTIPTHEQPYWKSIASGAITGVFSAMVLCPCDVAKCRAQTNIANGLEYKGIPSIIRSLVQQRGVKSLFTGLQAQIIRDIPFYASFFGSYEIITRLMKKHTDLPDASIYFLAGG